MLIEIFFSREKSFMIGLTYLTYLLVLRQTKKTCSSREN